MPGNQATMKKVTCLTLLFLLALAQPLFPQASRVKMNVNYPAIGGLVTALWVAAEGKIFEKYGLEVNPLYIPSAALAVRALLGGELAIAFGGGKPVVDAALAGAELVVIGGVANVPAFYLMALPEIQSISELRGKTVGVTRFGASTDFTMRHLLKNAKIDPEREVNILQVGGMPELAAAISKRLIVAAPFTPPTNLWAKKAGAKVLVNVAQAGVHFPHVCIFARRSYIRSNRETVVNFLKGYSGGLQRMVADKAFAKKVIQKYNREKDDEILEATYQYGLDYIVRLPYPTLEGVAEILRQTEHPKAKTARPEDFVDLTLVKGLVEAGFFTRK
jgi:NitT/TauT family transport system substrate-binding protein